MSKVDKKTSNSSTLSKHLAQHNHWPGLKMGEIPNPIQIRSICNFEILYHANPISAVRTFNTARCKICAKEQLLILQHSFDPSCRLMNARSKIHSSCSHTPEFHRFSTDESLLDKKVTNANNFSVIETNIHTRMTQPNYNNGIPPNYCCFPIKENNKTVGETINV